MSAGGRKALVACAVIDGHVVACEEEVLPRVRAIERAKELGLDPTPLIRQTERVQAVHLEEAKGRPAQQRRQR